MLRRTINAVIASCVLVCPFFADATVHAQTPEPTVSRNLPNDVEIPSGFTGDPVAFFDDFSWRSFVALNWPAADAGRGLPHPTKAFGEAADHVVWGTWKADHEIFQPNGMEPSEWDLFQAVSPDPFLPFAEAGRTRVLGGFGARGSDLQIEHYNQANAAGLAQGSLVDRNRRYVRYEIRINRTEFEFIRNRKFYLGEKIDEEVQAKGQLLFPFGSAEIKASWRVFTTAELADPNLLAKYYRSEAVLIDPSGARTLATIGLVGLHIVRRTPSRPEWIWSTFEHVDNDVGPNSSLLVASDPNPATWNKLRPKVNQDNPPLSDPDPVAVKRLRNMRSETTAANNAYLGHDQIKNTVWKNYRLVMTQWPKDPAQSETEFIQRFLNQDYPQGAGKPSPDEQSAHPIANLTMETTSTFQNNSSCMKCHFNAGKLSKTEFVWTVPLRAFRKPADAAAVAQRLQESVGPLMQKLEAK